ncbi:hypothetical protein Bbelb_080840 [Branchiostoma belcheri]|nr:hypothetical protein Bbelb_080840 [Branchiostoma belcheri]
MGICQEPRAFGARLAPTVLAGPLKQWEELSPSPFKILATGMLTISESDEGSLNLRGSGQAFLQYFPKSGPTSTKLVLLQSRLTFRGFSERWSYFRVRPGLPNIP